MPLNLSLLQFTGSTTLYPESLRVINYTDGIKHLADEAEAYWLVDAIASHQTKKLLQNPNLQEFQLWELKVNNDKSAILTCSEDSDCTAVISQEIEYTDFPLPEIKLYLIHKVLMLPSEY